MVWMRAIAVWALIMAVETVNGILRGLLLAPHLGDLLARQIALPFAALMILLIAVLTRRWLDARNVATQLGAGVIWSTLTLAFEFLIGTLLGFNTQRILADYDFTRGGFMALGLAFMAMCPWLAAKLRR
jgi:hypothetical protein